jgi:hypothetical protein
MHRSADSSVDASWSLRVMRHFLEQRFWRFVYAAIMTAWLFGLLFVQWLLFMGPSTLWLETVTNIPFVDLGHRVREQLSKPLSPPVR